MEHFSDDSSDPDTPEAFKSGKYTLMLTERGKHKTTKSWTVSASSLFFSLPLSLSLEFLL